MRTLVDIAEDDLVLLKKLSTEGGVSRAEIVRRAIAEYLKPRRRAVTGEAFGLWADKEEDGLAYQERMRGEWPD